MDELRRKLDELKTIGRGYAAPAAPPAAPARLHDVVGGCELCCEGVACWQIETPLENACARHGFAIPERLAAFATAPASQSLGDIAPHAAVVIDIETGGFAGTEIFLVGLIPLERRPLCVIQWLARDYAEEAALLHALARLGPQRNTWVTFNGKSFDGPFLSDRAALHRVPLRLPENHFDLLHHARRRWKGELPNCRLRTLEQQILGWKRIGDVDGWDIPDLFHHFLRTGNAAPLQPVLHHNQLDLISCTELLLRMVGT
jgi:uncharacterized protein YprB with RNaseH-like and TPR domain